NVTLELGFAMAVSEQWYIALDPSKTETREVPSDLRGLDRIEYASYSELQSKLTLLIDERYPKRKRAGLEEILEERRSEVRALLAKSPGLTVKAIAQLLGMELPVAQLVVKPMVGQDLETTGATRGMKYFLRGGSSRA